MSEHTHGEYEVSNGQKRYYTPTTEEVRDFVTQIYGNDSSLARARAEAVGLWFDNWLAEHDQELSAEVWDKGYVAGLSDSWADTPDATENPHRQGEEQ